MSLFVFDTSGTQNISDYENINERTTTCETYIKKRPLVLKPLPDDGIDPGSEEEDDGEYGGLPPPNHDISATLKKLLANNESNTKAEDEVEYSLPKDNPAKTIRYQNRPNKNLVFEDYDKSIGRFSESISETNVMDVLKKTNIDGIEREKAVPQFSDKKLQELRKIQNANSKNEGWFNMKATEMTEEVENDLKIIQMRSVLNPKQFYKKNDLIVLPKFFQIGTVLHSPLDYFKERDERSKKKKSLVNELLTDAEFQKFTKRKYKEVSARNDKKIHKKNRERNRKAKKKN